MRAPIVLSVEEGRSLLGAHLSDCADNEQIRVSLPGESFVDCLPVVKRASNGQEVELGEVDYDALKELYQTLP